MRRPLVAFVGLVLGCRQAASMHGMAPNAKTADPCVGTAPPAATDHSLPMVVSNQASNDGGVVSVAVADMDGDGQEDIVVGRGGFDSNEMGVLEILYGPFAHADGCSATSVSASAARTWSSTARRPFAKVTTGDIDRDGCLDVVAGNFEGGIEVFLGHRKGTQCSLGQATHVDVIASGVAGTDLELADLDGDGALDLAVGRSDRDHPTKAQPQAIIWNRSNALDFAHPWTTEESLVGTFAVAVGDFDGDGVRDVIFGGRGRDDNADGGVLWGALHLGVKNQAPTTAPIALAWAAPGPTRLSDVPYVVDIDAWGARVLVLSSGHWCGTKSCWDRSTPAQYTWSGSTMVPTTGLGGPPGNWLPGSTGPLDDDTQPDAVYPFACGTRIQRPGRLQLHQSSVANFEARQIATPNEVIRAVVTADVDSSATGIELVVGGAGTTSSGGTTNSGHISLITRCPTTRSTP